MRIKLLFIFTVILVSSSYCLAQPSSPELERLKKEILTAIGVPHADSPDECAAIGFGIKPCGGFLFAVVVGAFVQHVAEVSFESSER